MFKVGINRTEKEAIVVVKTDVLGEKAFKFESLSPKITREHLRLILPLMIANEREKRHIRVHRKAELKALREEKKARSEGYGTQKHETGEV